MSKLRVIVKPAGGLKRVIDFDSHEGSVDDVVERVHSAVGAKTRVARAPHTRLADTEPAPPADDDEG